MLASTECPVQHRWWLERHAERREVRLVEMRRVDKKVDKKQRWAAGYVEGGGKWANVIMKVSND